MSKITELMIRKPSLKYRDVRNYEGEYYDWAAGEHLLKKSTSVNELFHPLENDIRFIKDEQVPMRDGVKIMCLPTTSRTTTRASVCARMWVRRAVSSPMPTIPCGRTTMSRNM